MKRASNDTIAGRRYLELQRQAKRTGRPTDALIQLYALECLLDRLVHSKFADTFVLKGGVLLAALDARRPTRDIDFAVRAIENTTEKGLVGGTNNRRWKMDMSHRGPPKSCEILATNISRLLPQD